MMKYAIGIDIGGTKISVTLGSSDGKILARKKILTKTGFGAKACVREILRDVGDLIRDTQAEGRTIVGIGIGTPGPVNSIKGILPRSPNLPGWTGIPLCKILRKKFGLPVTIANDANAAAVGEAVFGAGKKLKDLIYVTVSTGVGGGIVINGRLHEGAGFVAGEIGHISVVPEGKRCKCGSRGCLEVYASGTAIAASYSSFAKKRIAGAKEVGAAFQAGDKLALKSFRQAAYYLGIGLANLMNILNPEAIVIGGGVLKSSPREYWQAVVRSTKRHAWPEAFRTTKILPSPLLGHSGDLGALALAFRK